MIVFITGASSGLGVALAREYVRRYPGCTLGLTARREEQLRLLANSLCQPAAGRATTGRETGTIATCHIYPLDITDFDGLATAADDFLARVGPPDVVIANAGVSAGTRAGDGQVFRHILQVNVAGLQATLDAFVPRMLAAGKGTLVGIGSVAGVRGLPGSSAYSASKAAVRTYLESLRVELHDTPLNVVTIAPGFIRTPMTQANNYTMPFLMDANRFATQAVDAISSGRRYVVIPWQMGWVARALGCLPRFVYDRLFANAPRKSRLAEQQSPGSGSPDSGPGQPPAP
ncbi:MAG: SDR family oxidoreductase [Burkholderiaceae bacterium]